jgi:hypothetical protein
VQDVLDITLLVTAVFERLGVAYLVGGSLASSLHGIPRATQDVDLVADLRSEHVSPFVDALQDTFYVDDAMIRNAIHRRASFNVIHLATMFKIDVFLPEHDVVLRQEMQRRQAYPLAGGRHLVVASPEDTILHKLHWYRLGGEVSDRQWNDVLGVMKVQGASLNQAYLTQTAVLLDVADLLQHALREADLT